MSLLNNLVLLNVVRVRSTYNKALKIGMVIQIYFNFLPRIIIWGNYEFNCLRQLIRIFVFYIKFNLIILLRCCQFCQSLVTILCGKKTRTRSFPQSNRWNIRTKKHMHKFLINWDECRH
eukprot:NODE_43_length_33755_cov_1.178542.p34 type:complete len:119 gc:universal NODE_43_length_33755_cov_1.178542:15918-15562(-)